MNDNAHATSRVDMCSLITLAKHHHDNGNLSVVEDNNEIPFKIRRVYYLYDIPGGEERGGHSHRECYTLLVAVSGSFTVVLDDGIGIGHIDIGDRVCPTGGAEQQTVARGMIASPRSLGRHLDQTAIGVLTTAG